MAKLFILVVILAILNCMHAYGSETGYKTYTKDQEEPQLNNQPYSVFESKKVDNKDNVNIQGQRHKRWYNPIPYSYQPPYMRPYDSSEEFESTLKYIKSRLQEVLDLARTPQPPPPPAFNQVPVFIPIYIPQPLCSCNPVYNNPPTTVAPTTAPTVPTTNTTQNNGTVPEFFDRFPEMEDERQNWGILNNVTADNYDDDDYGSRPISLVPVLTGNDMSGNLPPVEHGSVQADVKDPQIQLTTTMAPAGVFPSTKNTILAAESTNLCDKAIIGCCIARPIDKCMRLQECQGISMGTNPCDRETLLKIIARLQVALK